MHVVNGKEERGQFHSLYNTGEALAALALYEALQSHLDPKAARPTVGIIATYKAQSVPFCLPSIPALVLTLQ